MTKEELLDKTNHSLRMKDLRKFVEANKDLDDDAPCVVERVEDSYFQERLWHDGTTIGGWDVLKVEGYHYYNSLEWNKRMQEEADRRQAGEESEYGMDNPLDHIFSEKRLEEM